MHSWCKPHVRCQHLSLMKIVSFFCLTKKIQLMATIRDQWCRLQLNGTLGLVNFWPIGIILLIFFKMLRNKKILHLVVFQSCLVRFNEWTKIAQVAAFSWNVTSKVKPVDKEESRVSRESNPAFLSSPERPHEHFLYLHFSLISLSQTFQFWLISFLAVWENVPFNIFQVGGIVGGGGLTKTSTDRGWPNCRAC